jgi:enamine deaminase RidA (YjgF/YER057c/UK114 family)
MVSGKDPQPSGAERPLAEGRLEQLGIQLPAAPTPFGTYVEAVQTGNLLFLSGMLPVVDHKPKYVGRVGKELDLEAGRDAVRIAALGALAAAKNHLGSLDRISRVVRLGIFIATSGDSVDQPRIADAVSDLYRDIFGIEKTSVRVILGVRQSSPWRGDRTRCPLRSPVKTARTEL